MKKTVYMLPALIAQLNRKVDKLNKRAAKLGLTPVALTVNPDSKITICKPNGNTIRKIRVDIEGAPVVLSGWEYLGSIRALSNGEVLVSYDAPEAYRATPRKCDHCKTNRRRAVTVALRKIATGETVQVGRTCLADYLDDSDAVALADWLEKINKVATEEAARDSFSGGRGSVQEPDTFTFMAFVSAAMKANDGYYDRYAVRGVAVRDYYGLKIIQGETPRVTPDDSDHKAAQEIVDWVRNLDAEFGYLRNLKSSLAGALIPHKAIGLAASAFVAKKKADETEAERIAREAAKEARANRNAGSVHFGEIKKRSTFDLTVTACRVYEVESYRGYGMDTKTAVSMIDADGNLAVWFASGYRNYRLGEVFKVKATPKKHGTDREGNAQTVLNRCVFPAGSEADED